MWPQEQHWQHPAHPSPSSGSLANRQAFVYGYYLDSKFKVLCSHQVLEYYCEGMLGRWFQSYARWSLSTFPEVKPWTQTITETILAQWVREFYLNNFHHCVIKKLKSLSQSQMSLCCWHPVLTTLAHFSFLDEILSRSQLAYCKIIAHGWWLLFLVNWKVSSKIQLKTQELLWRSEK